jgi:nucleoside-diphosphate-sugar epimerase
LKNGRKKKKKSGGQWKDEDLEAMKLDDITEYEGETSEAIDSFEAWYLEEVQYGTVEQCQAQGKAEEQCRPALKAMQKLYWLYCEKNELPRLHQRSDPPFASKLKEKGHDPKTGKTEGAGQRKVNAGGKKRADGESFVSNVLTIKGYTFGYIKISSENAVYRTTEKVYFPGTLTGERHKGTPFKPNSLNLITSATSLNSLDALNDLQSDVKNQLSPTSYYVVSKLAGERYVEVFGKMYGLNYSILRYYHVYGSRQVSSDYGGVVAIFIKKCLKKEPITIYGTGEQLRSFTYVKDIVNANFLCVSDKRTNGQIYNACSGVQISIQELCDMTKEKLGCKNLEVKYEEWRKGDIKYFKVSNKKISALGIAFQKNFSEVMDNVIEEYKIYLK